MIFDYVSYQCEISDKPFTDELGNTFKKTAEVTFYDHFGKELDCRDYGYIDANEIYNRIHETGRLCLDNCFVRNFSFTAFRRLQLLDKKEVVKIKSLSAHSAFFESNYSIDFSYIEVEDGKIDFSNTYFICNELTFAFSNFGTGKKNFSYAFFGVKKLDFSNIHFGDGEVVFKNSVFKDGVKDFQYAHFGTGETNFTNCEFNKGDVSFINAVFGDGEVTFKIARFGEGKVDFHYAKFGSGDISFERTEFGPGKTDFRFVEFSDGRVNFNRSIFGAGEVAFEGAELKKGKFNIKKAEFTSGALLFEMAEFEDADIFFDKTIFGQCNISFLKSKFNRLSLQSCNLDKYVDLRVAKSRYVDLSDTIVRDIIDLKPFDFKIDIHILNMNGMRLLGNIYISWKDNNLKEIIYNQKDDTSFAGKANQFQMLKSCFNKTGQFTDEDKAYIEFCRCLSYSALHNEENTKKPLWYRKLMYYLEWLTIDQAGYYATSPVRVLFAVTFVYILFSFSYVFLYLVSDSDVISTVGDPHRMGLLARSFYHSAITFLTIGYGDHVPLGLARVFSALEGFSGVFLMSYFTVSLVRKILR